MAVKNTGAHFVGVQGQVLRALSLWFFQQVLKRFLVEIGTQKSALC